MNVMGLQKNQNGIKINRLILFNISKQINEL